LFHIVNSDQEVSISAFLAVLLKKVFNIGDVLFVYEFGGLNLVEFYVETGDDSDGAEDPFELVKSYRFTVAGVDV